MCNESRHRVLRLRNPRRGGAGLGAVRLPKAEGPGAVGALGAALLPLSALVILWSWLTTIGIDPVVGPWSAARLAPAMSLRHGYALYSPPGSGPVTGWIYPPLATLAYLPATLIPDPTSAVLAGRCLSLVYFFAPAAWLLMTDRTDRTRWTGSAGALLFAGFALLSAQSRPLRYCSTEIHADAPALGLAAPGGRPDGAEPARGSAVAPGRRPAPGHALGVDQAAHGPRPADRPALLGLPDGGSERVAPSGRDGHRRRPGAFRSCSWRLSTRRHTIFNIVTIPLLHPRRMGAITWAVSNLLELEQRQILLLLVLASGVLGQLTRKSHELPVRWRADLRALGAVPLRRRGRIPPLPDGVPQSGRRR